MTERRTVGIIYNSYHEKHYSDSTSPENPERISRIIRYLQGRTDIFQNGCELLTDFKKATVEDLLRVHDKEYIKFVREYSLRGGGFVGDSTYINEYTYECALIAAGGAIFAGELFMNKKVDIPFLLARPPGHHASKSKFGGYCIFNNAVILARYLQEKYNIKKIMIIDYDVHAANGTMEITYDDPTIFLISVHRSPIDFYPQDGFAYQIGCGYGRGYNVNVEMPQGSSDAEYMYVLHKVIEPLYNQYKPEIIICCVGFDAHYSESGTGMLITTKGYYEFTKALLKIPGENNAIMLFEGGYNQNNPQIAHAVLHAMMNLPYPEIKEQFDVLSTSVTREKATAKLLKDNLEKLREYLLDYFKI